MTEQSTNSFTLLFLSRKKRVMIEEGGGRRGEAGPKQNKVVYVLRAECL